MLRTWVTSGSGCHAEFTQLLSPKLWRIEAETEYGDCYAQVCLASTPWQPVGSRYRTMKSYVASLIQVRAEAKEYNKWRLLTEEEAMVLLMGGV